jgi:hypothetical protein
MTDDDLRALQEQAHMLYELSEHPGWAVYVDYLETVTRSQKMAVLNGNVTRLRAVQVDHGRTARNPQGAQRAPRRRRDGGRRTRPQTRGERRERHGRRMTSPNKIVSDFGKLYYSSDVFNDTYYMGVPTVKCPTDMHAYQEILYATRPELIVETGTFCGGSAYMLGNLLDILSLREGHEGHVVSIDIRSGEGIDCRSIRASSS